MALTFVNIGGAEGDRTPDLMNAIHALSQLSYGPFLISAKLADVSATNDRGELCLIQFSVTEPRAVATGC